jgi:hypothetical protein
MISFITHFDTSRDYTLQFTITHTYTNVHNHVFTVVAWYWLSSVDVLLHMGYRTVPDLSYQLLTKTAHND